MWAKLKKKFLNRQFITFAVIGVINTVIALLINKGLIIMGVEVGLASIVADVLAFVPSYLMNMKFTYHQEYSWKSFIAFPVSYVPGWIISFVIVEILSRGLGVPERYAKIVSVPIYVPVNYLFMTYIVGRFAKKKDTEAAA
jgi:putative flippase GtrA